MGHSFYNAIEDNPIIAAINNVKQIDDAIKSPCKIAFLLTGDILNIEDIVKELRV